MVAEIRALCKAKKTTIAAMERELGFGNGTISRWDKSVPNYERLSAVAAYLDVPMSTLTGSKAPEETPLTATQAEAMALIRSMSDEDLKRFIKIAKAMLE